MTMATPCLVRARMIEFMAGDSCVQIEVGSNGHLQKFWVPTKDIVGLENAATIEPGVNAQKTTVMIC
jgi:hypothetical protein